MRLIFRWAPAILWALLIFYLSSVPGLQVTSEPVGNFLTRKAAHLGEYTILFLLIFRAQDYQKVVRAIFLTAIYGVSDELHQSFVPTREAKLTDVLFDLAGAIIGVLIWRYLPTLRQKLRI